VHIAANGTGHGEFACPVTGSIKRLLICDDVNTVVAGELIGLDIYFPWNMSIGFGSDIFMTWIHHHPNYNTMNEELNVPCTKGDVLMVNGINVSPISCDLRIVIVWEAERDEDILIGERTA